MNGMDEQEQERHAAMAYLRDGTRLIAATAANSMDEQPVKVAKITIHVDYMDGSAIEALAVEPHNTEVEIAYPDPEFNLSDPVKLTSRQPPPTITFRFTVNQDHGWQERHITRAEMEAKAARLDGIAPN